VSSAADDIQEQPLRVAPMLIPGVLALAAETALAYALVEQSAPALQVVAGHAVVSALLVAAAWYRIRRGRDARLDTLLAWTTMVTGPLGPASVLAIAALMPWFARSARPFDEWYADLFPDEDQDASDRLYERIVTGREEAVVDTSSLSSLTDMLLTGSTPTKQAVVALLARRFRSDFAPALAMALSDPEPTVRVQAATAAATIEERYHNRRVEIEDTTRALPQDAKTWLTLARHLDDYAYAGVLDPDRQLQTMQDAQAAYERAETLGADDPSAIKLARGRLLLRIGKIEEAETLLASVIGTVDDPRAAMWQAECLFRLRRFNDLRRHLDHPDLAELALDPRHAALGPAINLWHIGELLDLEPVSADGVAP